MNRNINNYYVYTHIDPRTNEIRYVGKGNRDRAYRINSGRSGHHKNWLKQLKLLDLRPIILILEKDLEEKQALLREKELILEYRNKGLKLTNLTDGGDGMSGHKPSEETKRKISESRMGIKNPMFGRVAHNRGVPPSEESKRKNSESHLGKISPNKGRPMLEATKKKLSEGRIGKKSSEETKRKISISQTGRKSSEETKKKLSRSKMGNKSRSKQVIDIVNGFVWDSVKEAADIYGISHSTLVYYLLGTYKNKTNLRYFNDVQSVVDHV